MLELGFTVTTASDGEDGLRIIREVNPRIILTDNSMPRMDGITLIITLNTCTVLRTIPVIMVSSDIGNLRMKAVSMGAEFIPKPFVQDDVVEVVRKMLKI